MKLFSHANKRYCFLPEGFSLFSPHKLILLALYAMATSVMLNLTHRIHVEGPGSIITTVSFSSSSESNHQKLGLAPLVIPKI